MRFILSLLLCIVFNDADNNNNNNNNNNFQWGNSPLVGQGFLIIQAPRSQTPLDEWSARHIDLSQSDLTQRLHETDIISPAGFEPATTASERPHTHTLDGAATGTDIIIIIIKLISSFWLTPGCHSGSPFKLNARNKAVITSGWHRNGMNVDGSCHDLLCDTIPSFVLKNRVKPLKESAGICGSIIGTWTGYLKNTRQRRYRCSVPVVAHTLCMWRKYWNTYINSRFWQEWKFNELKYNIW